MRVVLAIFISFCFTFLQAQEELKGKVVDAKNQETVISTVLTNLNSGAKTRVNITGDFVLPATLGDSILITATDYDSLVVIVADFTYQTYFIKSKILMYDDVDIISDRYEDFDIGIPPVITDSRIHYGKSEFIPLKNLSGQNLRGILENYTPKFQV